jgi:RNA polymerase sigma factor for flagellar operon FliA
MAGAQFPTAQTGEALFASQLDVIERVISFVSSRHHLPGAEADDFSSHVKLKLIEDNYAILGKFQGRSSLRTYLTVVIQRLFLDYRISAWGKWRPSAEAVRAGEVAVLLERLMSREGHTFEEACELIETNHQVTVPRPELEAIAGRLPGRMRRRFESDAALAHVPADLPPLDDVIAERERVDTAARVGGALKAAMAGLDAQDRLIIALRFHDGRTIVEVAHMLRLDQKGLYRRLERLMKDLRTALEARGIAATAVMEMFQSPAVSIDWKGDTKGTPKPRPSMGKGGQEWC